MLDSTVVHEDISRYSGAGGVLHQLDRFGAMVEISDGAEEYLSVERGGRRYDHVSQIPGTWSFGEVSSILSKSRDALAECALTTVTTPAKDSPRNVVRFSCSAASRRWFITVNSRVYWLDFTGEIATSELNKEIVEVCWISGRLPRETGIEHIEWSVRFEPTEISGLALVLPDTAEFRVIHTGESHRTESNVTKFDRWSRYGSQASISFEEQIAK